MSFIYDNNFGKGSLFSELKFRKSQGIKFEYYQRDLIDSFKEIIHCFPCSPKEFNESIREVNHFSTGRNISEEIYSWNVDNEKTLNLDFKCGKDLTRILSMDLEKNKAFMKSYTNFLYSEETMEYCSAKVGEMVRILESAQTKPL